MNSTNPQQATGRTPTGARLIVKVSNVTAMAPDTYFIDFKDHTGKQYEKKAVLGTLSEVVIQNLGCGAIKWQDAPKAIGKIVQIVLDQAGNRVLYVNEVDQATGKPIFKKNVAPAAPASPPKDMGDPGWYASLQKAPENAPLASDPAAYKPGITEEECEYTFPDYGSPEAPPKKQDMIAGAPLSPVDAITRDANLVMFKKLSTSDQELALRLIENISALKKIINGGK